MRPIEARFGTCAPAIDYQEAVAGGLQLVPTGPALGTLADDYAKMLENGMLLGDEEMFDHIVGRCTEIEVRANRYANNA